jgi:hypothetical protein
MPQNNALILLKQKSNEQRQPMTTDTLTPTEVIEQMIDLHIQQAELEQQIQFLKPAFFDACTDSPR